MAELDPFHYPIPGKLLSDPELRPWVTYLHKYLQQSWVKLGGSEDAIETTISRDAYDSTTFSSGVAEALRRIDCLEKRNLYSDSTQYLQAFINKTISGEVFTATDFMIVNMTNRSTLKLPQRPKKDSRVIFTKDGTPAKLDGNGRPVNGTNRLIKFNKARLARQCAYFIETDEWYFI